MTRAGAAQLGFRLAFGAALVVISYLALAQSPAGGEVLWDKLNHLLAFACLSFLLDFSWRGHVVKWAGLATLGLLIELAQLYTGYRQFEWTDWLADCAGIGLYLLVRPGLLRLSMFASLQPGR